MSTNIYQTVDNRSDGIYTVGIDFITGKGLILLTKKIPLRSMLLISLFAALTAVGAFIKIPTPIVPFTLQFFFCTFAGLLLGGRYGLYSQLLYIFIGLIGLPIFAGGGGPAYVLQPTFGYLLGFAICSFIVGQYAATALKLSFIRLFSVITGGLLALYIAGVGYLYFILHFYLTKDLSLYQAIAIGFLPYITFDLLQSAAIAYIALRILPILRKNGFLPENK